MAAALRHPATTTTPPRSETVVAAEAYLPEETEAVAVEAAPVVPQTPGGPCLLYRRPSPSQDT